MRFLLPLLMAAGLATVVGASPGSGGDVQTSAHVPAPLADGIDSYEAASRIRLDHVEPIDHVDLHNVFRLSKNLISGSEPLGVAALERVARMGVKTLLSVDGKVPDRKTAERLGMRYVHVPIRYSGLSTRERLKIAKVFRELPGPFYVHCFHGRHRGPAAAAVGRIVLDGVSRELALPRCVSGAEPLRSTRACTA